MEIDSVDKAKSQPGSSQQLMTFPTMDLQMMETSWDFPQGIDQPAIVLHINNFVKEDDVYVPCEIGMTCFSVKRGIIKTFTAILEPVGIPDSHLLKAVVSSGFFGVPCSPLSEASQYFRTKIMEIEKFLRSDVEDKKALIFCAKETLEGAEKSLVYCFSEAGLLFNHKIYPLEKLMIALSQGGLQAFGTSLPETQNWTSLQAFISHVVKICKMKRENGYQQIPSDMVINAFNNDFHPTKPNIFTKLGPVPRFAASKWPDHPAAFLGAFLNEEDAQAYLAMSRIVYGTKLGCSYHNVDNAIRRHEELTRRDVIDQSSYCARSISLRQVYLILDVVLPNYGIEPSAALHYPR